MWSEHRALPRTSTVHCLSSRPLALYRVNVAPYVVVLARNGAAALLLIVSPFSVIVADDAVGVRC